ncbi:MAG TPA: hypothetical protein VGH19_18745 [Verrucomicrobiae bacterium]
MLKRFTLYLVALASLLVTQNAARAFSLLGPITGNPAISTWQIFANGYNFGTDIGGVMNRGEGYRWNVPVLYVAFDDSFIEYFGNRGVSEVESALYTFNTMTNFSLMSSNLNEFPLRTTRVNFRAQALGLQDLKSTTMRAMVEELGLTQPERYAFTLRDRNVTTFNGVTYTNYLVIMRNFDPVSHQPTAFVNGTLYTYDLREDYTLIGAHEAAERPVDTSAFTFTSVAYSAPLIGHFFTGLTRDDVGGLRYLYGTNNIAGERLLTDTQIVVTNSNQLVVRTGDLGLLTRQSTNTILTPPQMQLAFPGIQFAAITTNVGLVNLTSVVSGNIVITPTVTNIYSYIYGNVVTNFITNQARASVQTILVTSNQVGFVTNVLDRVEFVTNEVAGTFYIITNGAFAYDILEQINIVTNEQRTIVVTNISTTAYFTNTAPGARVLVEATNDLHELIQFSSTNAPAAVIARYPGILLTSTNIYLTNLVQETYFSYITNFYTDPAFLLGRVVVGTNMVTNVIAAYSYTFGNVVTNQYYTNGFITSRTINIGFNGVSSPYNPAFGVTNITTNIITSTTFQSHTNGTFYIVPTNLVGYNVLATMYESPTAITNTLVSAGFTFGGQTLSNIIQQIRYRTNSVLLAEPILLQNPTNIVISQLGIRQELVREVLTVNYRVLPLYLSNSAAMGPHVRRGTDRIQFRRLPYDSVLARVINPVTNWFLSSMTVTNGTNILTLGLNGITNVYSTSGYTVSGTNYNQIEVRAVTQPDFLYEAGDLGFFSSDVTGIRVPVLFRRENTANWINNDTINGTSQLAGPGVITGPITISYNNVGPAVSHQTPRTLGQTSPILIHFTWGTYDGSGAEPVVYPIGTGIDTLESQILNGP